jgi:hypothetical protein
MAAKAKLAIVGGVAALVAVLAAYALVVGMHGITKVSVNEEKRGKGTVDTLSFKNPVTIRLIDKNGNVASETVVYNAITDDGKAYIVDALSTSGSFAPIEAIRFANTSDDSVATDALKDNGTTPNVAEVTDGEQTCTTLTADTGTGTVTCVVTFTFDDDGDSTNGNQPYQPAAGATTLSLDLDTGKELRIGSGTGSSFTPYFNNTSFSIGVNAGTEYTQIQITWTITIP